jgi:hypothetical protein
MEKRKQILSTMAERVVNAENDFEELGEQIVSRKRGELLLRRVSESAFVSDRLSSRRVPTF